MAIIAILVGLIGAVVGIVVGAVGGFIGISLGLLGGLLGSLPHLFPAALIAIGIIWLARGASTSKVAGTGSGRRIAGQPQSPTGPR